MLEKAKEEEENKAALHRIQLYRINYELQKNLEATEAKFKREFEKAWKRPRHSPTVEEERRNKLAFETIESKAIFDEFGEPQRPIRTDPKLVNLETRVNTLITRARIQHCLEDYRQMYDHANRAAEASSKLEFRPLTARCCYYRGVAMYLHRDFESAKKDFLEARGCADHYGISRENIERYIHLIDSAEDPETAILERFPARKANKALVDGRKTRTRRRDTDSGNEHSPSTAINATTLAGDSPRSPRYRALALSPFGSPNEEERSTGHAADSQTQILRRPSHIDAIPPDDDPQPANDDISNYQPQDEAISEEIRTDIQESKARSLSVVSEAVPAVADPQEETISPPPSMASTEYTLLGSANSPGTTRRVPRPYVAPITTSSTTASNTIGEASQEANPGSGDVDEGVSDEMDEDNIYAMFGGKSREDADSDSAKWSSPRQSWG